MSLTKRYDPLSRVVSNYTGDRIFVITPFVIRYFLTLTSNVSLLEKIDLSEFQSRYEAHALYLRAGPLREQFVKLEDYVWSCLPSLSH